MKPWGFKKTADGGVWIYDFLLLASGALLFALLAPIGKLPKPVENFPVPGSVDAAALPIVRELTAEIEAREAELDQLADALDAMRLERDEAVALLKGVGR